MRRLALVSALGLMLLTSSSVFAATGSHATAAAHHTTAASHVTTANQTWRATLPSTTVTTDPNATPATTVSVRGGATLALVGNGTRGSVAVKLYGVKPKWTVTVTVAGTTLTISHDKFKMAANGVHRFWLSKAEVAALKTAIASKATLTVNVTVTPPSPGTAATLTGTFAKVTHN